MNEQTKQLVEDCLKSLDLPKNKEDLVKAMSAAIYAIGRSEGLREARELL